MGCEPFSSALRMNNIKNYKYDWIWNKVSAANFVQAKNQPLTKRDFIDNFNKNQTFNCKIDFTDFDNVFVSKSQLNSFRRLVFETVEKSLTKNINAVW